MAGKKDKNATLVGFFLFLGLICLGGLIAQFSNIKGLWSGDYQIHVIFGDASGLVKDSDVTRGGAKIGRVLGRPTMRPDGQVQVTLSIKGNVKIMEGSSISIYSVSLLGDRRRKSQLLPCEGVSEDGAQGREIPALRGPWAMPASSDGQTSFAPAVFMGARPGPQNEDFSVPLSKRQPPFHPSARALPVPSEAIGGRQPRRGGALVSPSSPHPSIRSLAARIGTVFLVGFIP